MVLKCSKSPVKTFKNIKYGKGGQMFAKLFETEKHGQILVKIDTDINEDPEVRIFFKPEGLGVCSMAVSSDDSDDGWTAIEKAFEKFGEVEAIKAVDHLSEELGIFG